ncbi:hypothetical protein ABEB36_009924 [Hypothenemus hampei]
MDDEDVDNMESEEDRRCPDCGKMFDSSRNRRRHESKMHAKKDRRCQMKEIKKPQDDRVDSSQTQLEQATLNDSKTREDTQLIESNTSVNSQACQDDEPPKLDPIGNHESEATEKHNDNDEKKIKFAAGLQLFQKDSSPIELQSLSKIELSYIEKCKAMVSMFHTFQCACHNVQHKTLRNLLSHLRETRIWFPLFTCYNCMISLTDRSTFNRHYSKCSRPLLESLTKLSNLRKRSELKPRLYQNYKCNRCKFMFSFHEDFCKHVEEDHVNDLITPFYCSCRFVFDNPEEYKAHCYTSCVLSYYCDICFITTSTIEEFIKHSQENHDSSEGFLLQQENNYVPRNHTIRHKEADDEANVLEGKRERRKSSKEPIMVQIYDNEIPSDSKDISTSAVKKMIEMDLGMEIGWSRSPASCPLCKKRYSSVSNMVRHYKTHIERKEIEIPKLENESENEDLYTCPDCGGVYPASKWKLHLQEKHSILKCTECDKQFNFQSELDQHRSVHLNLKVFRDSKTHAYKSTMVSPSIECDICNEVFATKEELKNHKSTHDAPNDDEPPVVLLENADRPYCETCERHFASDKSLKEHIINKHGSSFLKKKEYPKKCDLCDKVCTTGAAFKSHKRMHDRISMRQEEEQREKNEFPKKCEYCDQVCATGASLYLHTQMHERVTLGELKKKKKVEVIKPKEGDESYHTCNKCFKVFATKGRLKEHLKSHGIFNKGLKKGRKVLCDLCHIALDSPEELQQHKNEEHNEEDMLDIVYACNICDEICESKEQLAQHKTAHESKPKSNSKNFYCQYCKVHFESLNELTKHMHKQHDESAKPKAGKVKPNTENSNSCKICGKCFASHNALSTHTGWHKRLSNKMASSSTSKVEKRQKIFEKLYTPTSKKEPIDFPEYQCSTCLVELPNDTALQIHMLEKHGDLDSSMLVPRCDICNQDFTSEDEYEKHKRFHEFLERQKRHDQEMRTPIIQHVQSVFEGAENGSKRFPCDWCSSAFSRQDTLNTHIKHYHKEHMKTEFPCTFCRRVFNKQSSLTRHLIIHQRPDVDSGSSVGTTSQSGAKVYVCSLCNMSFNYPKDLRTHTINAHPF